MLRPARCSPIAPPCSCPSMITQTGAHFVDRGTLSGSRIIRAHTPRRTVASPRTSPRAALRPQSLLRNCRPAPPASARPTFGYADVSSRYTQPQTTPVRTYQSAPAHRSNLSIKGVLAELLAGLFSRTDTVISEHKVLRANLSVERQMHMLAYDCHAIPCLHCVLRFT